MLQQIQASGQQVSEQQLQMWLLQQYESSVLSNQARIFKDHNLEESDVREAVDVYYNSSSPNPAVVKSISKFKGLYKSIGGRPPSGASVELPKDIDLAKFCEIVKVYMEAMTECMRKIVSSHSDSSGSSTFSQSDLASIRSEFQAKADDYSNSVLKENYDIDQDTFAALMEHHQTDPNVQMLVQQLGAAQNQAFKSMGIA